MNKIERVINYTSDIHDLKDELINELDFGCEIIEGVLLDSYLVYNTDNNIEITFDGKTFNTDYIIFESVYATPNSSRYTLKLTDNEKDYDKFMEMVNEQWGE